MLLDGDLIHFVAMSGAKQTPNVDVARFFVTKKHLLRGK